MSRRLLVAGDSVADGARCEAPAWPARVGDRHDLAVRVEASMSWELATAGDHALAAIDESDAADGSDAADESNAPDESVTLLVQAGHNDCQLSGGEPRVSLDAFAATASELDERLAAHDRVARHAFVGLVPMGLREGVPFGGAQPARSHEYDDRLAATVSTHLSIREATDWADATVDGVHPNDRGHAVIADRVSRWL